MPELHFTFTDIGLAQVVGMLGVPVVVAIICVVVQCMALRRIEARTVRNPIVVVTSIIMCLALTLALLAWAATTFE